MSTPPVLAPPASGAPSLALTLKSLLTTLSTHKSHPLFAVPVDPVAHNALDYFDIVKAPMDFGCVSTKVDEGAYENLDSFLADAHLVFANCYLYNPPSNGVHAAAVKLERFFKSIVKRDFVGALKQFKWAPEPHPDAHKSSAADDSSAIRPRPRSSKRAHQSSNDLFDGDLTDLEELEVFAFELGVDFVDSDEESRVVYRPKSKTVASLPKTSSSIVVVAGDADSSLPLPLSSSAPGARSRTSLRPTTVAPPSTTTLKHSAVKPPKPAAKKQRTSKPTKTLHSAPLPEIPLTSPITSLIVQHPLNKDMIIPLVLESASRSLGSDTQGATAAATTAGTQVLGRFSPPPPVLNSEVFNLVAESESVVEGALPFGPSAISIPNVMEQTLSVMGQTLVGMDLIDTGMTAATLLKNERPTAAIAERAATTDSDTTLALPLLNAPAIANECRSTLAAPRATSESLILSAVPTLQAVEPTLTADPTLISTTLSSSSATAGDRRASSRSRPVPKPLATATIAPVAPKAPRASKSKAKASVGDVLLGYPSDLPPVVPMSGFPVALHPLQDQPRPKARSRSKPNGAMPAPAPAAAYITTSGYPHPGGPSMPAPVALLPSTTGYPANYPVPFSQDFTPYLPPPPSQTELQKKKKKKAKKEKIARQRGAISSMTITLLQMQQQLSLLTAKRMEDEAAEEAAQEKSEKAQQRLQQQKRQQEQQQHLEQQQLQRQHHQHQQRQQRQTYDYDAGDKREWGFSSDEDDESTQKKKRKPTPKSRSSAPSKSRSKPRAPAKPRSRATPRSKPKPSASSSAAAAMEDIVTYEDKAYLSTRLATLTDDQMDSVIEILRQEIPSLEGVEEELELDINNIQPTALKRLVDFVRGLDASATVDVDAVAGVPAGVVEDPAAFDAGGSGEGSKRVSATSSIAEIVAMEVVADLIDGVCGSTRADDDVAVVVDVAPLTNSDAELPLSLNTDTTTTITATTQQDTEMALATTEESSLLIVGLNASTTLAAPHPTMTTSIAFDSELHAPSVHSNFLHQTPDLASLIPPRPASPQLHHHAFLTGGEMDMGGMMMETSDLDIRFLTMPDADEKTALGRQDSAVGQTGMNVDVVVVADTPKSDIESTPFTHPTLPI